MGPRVLDPNYLLNEIVQHAGGNTFLPVLVDFPDLFHDFARALPGFGADHEPGSVRQEGDVPAEFLPVLLVGVGKFFLSVLYLSELLLWLEPLVPGLFV